MSTNPSTPPAFSFGKKPEVAAPETTVVAAPVTPAVQAVKPSTPARPQQFPAQPANTAPFKAKTPMSPQAEKDWLFTLLNDLGAEGMSDLHVHPGVGMWKLVDGKLRILEGGEYTLKEEDILKWMEYSDGYEDQGVDAPEKLLGTKGHTTVAFDTGEWRVRGSFRRSTVGVSATFRMIPRDIPSVEDVYLPQTMIDMIQKRSGLIIVEGPTGSGKSTSVAALIRYINEQDDLHIYSVEDPIEFHHTPMGSTVFTMREIGVHASDYASAVENALRSKPNVIFIGEMLDNATKKAALHAATTGHLVITTAHAGSVVEAIDSFIGGFNAEDQPQVRARLSTSLLGIMCQTLVPTKAGKLVAVREIMKSDVNFSGIIQKGDMAMLPGQLESSKGSISMDAAMIDLIQKGYLDIQVALNASKKPEQLHGELVRLKLIRSDQYR